tara:strand:- start:733 stop:906 length:174 start_codon:yes stop_codon:yes gene_type:complete
LYSVYNSGFTIDLEGLDDVFEYTKFSESIDNCSDSIVIIDIIINLIKDISILVYYKN